MDIDLHAHSLNLLETLANSVHDRDPKNPDPFFFNIKDTQVAEQWLSEFMRQVLKTQAP